jgi:hypothetical protein
MKPTKDVRRTMYTDIYIPNAFVASLNTNTTTRGTSHRQLKGFPHFNYRGCSRIKPQLHARICHSVVISAWFFRRKGRRLITRRYTRNDPVREGTFHQEFFPHVNVFLSAEHKIYRKCITREFFISHFSYHVQSRELVT